jgi:hypothetical protein
MIVKESNHILDKDTDSATSVSQMHDVKAENNRVKKKNMVYRL